MNRDEQLGSLIGAVELLLIDLRPAVPAALYAVPAALYAVPVAPYLAHSIDRVQTVLDAIKDSQ